MTTFRGEGRKAGAQTIGDVIPGDPDPMSAAARTMNAPRCGRDIPWHGHRYPCTRIAGHAADGRAHPANRHVHAPAPDHVVIARSIT